MSRPSPGLALAWRIAASEARLTGYPKIECPHLLMGLLSLDKASPKALRELDFDPAQMGQIQAEHAAIQELFKGAPAAPPALRRALRSRVRKRRPSRTGGLMSRSSASKAAFAQAEALAKDGPLNCLHLLTILLRASDPDIAALITDHRLDPDLHLKAEAVAPQNIQDPESSAPARKAPARKKTAPPIPATIESMLARFGRDLTAQAARGAIAPVFGREKQILTAIQILARPSRSHPLLVGEPGVGKTAIVEALANRSAAGPLAEALAGRRIVELNLRAFMSRSAGRGELESRMKALVDELEVSKDVILFVDDIHALVGAGRSGSVLESGNLFKRALARGVIHAIGATTVTEFRESLERDPALKRLKRVDVPEPSLDETMQILQGVKARLEKHHGVRITDEAIHAAVSLSVRFDPDHRLPHKAIDLVGKAAARSRPPMPGDGATPDAAGEGFVGVMVDERAVAEILAEKRGLPIEALTDGAGSGARLLKLEAHLKAKIVGQDDAVARVASRINLAHAALSNRDAPLAVFLLLGPSGVGKTELARCLATALFGSSDYLSFFSMSDFSSAESARQLLGSLPGSGSHLPPQLFDAIRRRPDSVIVLDDVEKAHATVMDALYELCDSGRITDTQGRVADASQSVVVMTSNVGSGSGPLAGFDAGETIPLNRGAQRKARVRKLLGPDFLDRIDEVINLQSLGEADVRRLARPLLARLVTRIRKTHGVFLRLNREAENHVIHAGFDAERGVRDLTAVIERLVEEPMSSLAQSGKLAKHPAWKAVLEGGSLRFLPE